MINDQQHHPAAPSQHRDLFDSGFAQRALDFGWEHINLSGDYTWHSNKRVAKGGFRPLRMPRSGFGAP
jgi:hypothetical protein